MCSRSRTRVRALRPGRSRCGRIAGATLELLGVRRDDTLLMRRLEGFSDLLGNRQRLVYGNRPLRDPIRQRRPLNQLQDERPRPLGFLDAVDLRDVGMVETGQYLRLSLKPSEAIRRVSECVRQYLQRDLAVELGVGGLPDLPHPALADEGRDVVAPYALESHWIRPETVPKRYSFLGSGRGECRRSGPCCAGVDRSFYVQAVTGSSRCTELPVDGTGTRSQRVVVRDGSRGRLARPVGLTWRTYASCPDRLARSPGWGPLDRDRAHV